MGWFDAFDHYVVSEDLDFASWDWYIGTGNHDYTKTGAIHDLTRGFKRKNFWIMETQPGSVNWSPINNMLNKGEVRCMAWHAVAHGADAILYWQWRSALGGQEQLHGSLLGADGNPRPFYSEAQQLGHDFEAVGEILEGTTPRNSVAILHAYDSRWSINWQRHHKDYDPAKQIERVYAPLISRNVGVDIISAEATLGEYKLVIAPAVVVLTPEATTHLIDFVTDGGILVIMTRTAQKDRHNALVFRLAAGAIARYCGRGSGGILRSRQARSRFRFVERRRNRSKEAGKVPCGRNSCARYPMTRKFWRRLANRTAGWTGSLRSTRHPFGEKGGQVITVGAVYRRGTAKRFYELASHA